MKLIALAFAAVLVTPSMADDTIDIMPMMESYYGCLVGTGASSAFFRAKPADEAFVIAKGACADLGKTLRDTVPLIAHEEGEENEADFVEGEALRAITRLRD